MSTHSDGAACASSAIRLGRHEFKFMEFLTPERDTSGAIQELSPQSRYMKCDAVPLHKHGHGTFCKFRISVPAKQAGVYALVANGSVRYIGECEDLGKRVNMGYGNISPRNCYEGGRRTNCKINHRVLDVCKAGGCVALYFYPTPQRHMVEKELIARCSPPWND